MSREILHTPQEEYELAERKHRNDEIKKERIEDVVMDSKERVTKDRRILKEAGEWNKLRALEYKTGELIISLAGKIAYGIRSVQASQSEKRLEGLRDQANEEALLEGEERRLADLRKRGEIAEAYESALALERRHEALQRRALAALEELSDFEEQQLGYARSEDSDNKLAEKPENSPNFE